MKRAKEPVPIQVYFDGEERRRLERLATQLNTTKSDVVRRGIAALERETLSPASHPALRLIGLAKSERKRRLRYDAGVEHDRIFARDERASWRPARAKRRRRRAR